MEFRDAFFAELGKSAGVTQLVKETTGRVARTARSTAPVDTGAYREGIQERIKPARYRNVGIVEGTDSKTLLIEAKTGNLARAVKVARRG